jgi:hypothetical protein
MTSQKKKMELVTLAARNYFRGVGRILSQTEIFKVCNAVRSASVQVC